MLVIAHHKINDTDKFWTMAQALTPSLPPYLKLHSVFPSMDKKSGTCIWEAASVKDVQQFLDNQLGSVSDNFCYEVNQESSIGLPLKAMEAFNN
jgi:hypothetical protein